MQESRKEAFYSDLVTLILVVLVVGVLVLLLSFSLLGDRVTTGIWLTGSISSIVFFYLRGRFSFWATLAQMLAIGGLTASQVWVIGLMLSELPIIKDTIGAIGLLIFFLGLFCINKQLIEYGLVKWGIRERSRKPIKMS